MQIEKKDRQILRELAKYQLELASSERNQKLYAEWMRYGSSKLPERPMIRIEIETFENEVLPGMMKCEGDAARRIERRMLRPIANFTLFEDDTLVPAYYPVLDHLYFVPFGLEVKRKVTDGVGHHFIPYLHELEEDDHLLGPSRFGLDAKSTEKEIEEAQEVFGDILPVKAEGDCYVSCLTQDIVHIMNMDDMYVSMIDEEDRFNDMMARLADDYIAWFESMETAGQMLSSARMQHLYQGSYCFTDELKDDIRGAKLKDCWLFMDSQETSGISPDMYRDLIFPHYKRIMDRFGLVSYGCCEASHPIWEDCLSRIENLRKVSVSPWCDEEYMGERLQGTGITFLRKPPATILGMSTPELDEEETLRCFRKTARAAKGCKLEIAQRDVYQIGHNPEKVRRYVELARQGLEEGM